MLASRLLRCSSVDLRLRSFSFSMAPSIEALMLLLLTLLSSETSRSELAESLLPASLRGRRSLDRARVGKSEGGSSVAMAARRRGFREWRRLYYSATRSWSRNCDSLSIHTWW